MRIRRTIAGIDPWLFCAPGVVPEGDAGGSLDGEGVPAAGGVGDGVLSGEGVGAAGGGTLGVGCGVVTGGLDTTTVPAVPLHVPPAASRTDRVGWNVPAAYACALVAPDPPVPSPNVQAKVYGASPPPAVAVSDT
jgi:hypothetical protein